MKLIVPVDVKEVSDILEFCLNAKEKLKLLHNEMGQKAKEGKMPIEDFRRWQNEYFMPRSQAIATEYLSAKKTIIDSSEEELKVSVQDKINGDKEALSNSNKYQINIEKDII